MRKVLVLLALVVATSSFAQTVRNLTDLPYDSFASPSQSALDDAGTSAYILSTTNQLGTNPRHAWQIFRWDLTSGAALQVTSFAKGVEGAVSVSDDGQWLAFVSCSDPVGSNHDASPELFVMSSDGAQLAQITSDPALASGSVYGAVIAGSGNRVAFVADTDPLGTNPGRRKQLFVVERDGTGLRQLTATSAEVGSPSVSDDGDRVTFTSDADLTGQNPAGTYQVFAMQADGTGLRQLTPSNGADFYSDGISGNGEKVVTSTVSNGVWNIFKVEWDGTGWLELATGLFASITDDGGTVVYESPDSPGPVEVWKVGTDATGNQQLTSSPAFSAYYPVVSGDGSRIVFDAYGEVPGGNNADGGSELVSMDSSGSGLLQLTDLTAHGYGFVPELSGDGRRAYFYSGWNAYGIYRIDTDGTGFAHVVDLINFQPVQLAPAPDGSWVVYVSGLPSGSGYALYKVNADGTGVAQITTTDFVLAQPVVTSDGLWVVYQRLNSVNRVRADGTTPGLVVSDGTLFKNPRVADGTNPWVVYQSETNTDGLNPDGSSELFRIRLSGLTKTRLTSDPVYSSVEPDVTGNGNGIVYASQADPLGTNPDHNYELFLYELPAATRRQLTFTTSGESRQPRISRDGAWVVFRSTAPFFEPNPDGHDEPYRLAVATGTVERLQGTRSRGADLYPPKDQEAVTIDRTGTKVAFTALGDWGGRNPDREYDIYLADLAAKPRLNVGKVAPTLLSWDDETKPVRYDVIRAVSADLSSVVCVEDDSPDTAAEDAAQPSAGQVFFYLYRGSQGVLDGPGSWGASSSGAQRMPGPGSCSP